MTTSPNSPLVAGLAGKIENEGFNVLKTKGYNLEHNFGHGKRNLSMVLAILNLLAFACHTVCELGGGMARGHARTGDAPGLLPSAADHHHVSCVRLLG